MTSRSRKKAKITDNTAGQQQQQQAHAAPSTVPHASALPSLSLALAAKDIVQNLRGIPKHLIKRIFDEQLGYKGEVYHANHIPYVPTSIGETMPELAMVSKGWFKVISQLVDEFEAVDGFFYFKDCSQGEFSAFYAKMEQ